MKICLSVQFQTDRFQVITDNLAALHQVYPVRMDQHKVILVPEVMLDTQFLLDHMIHIIQDGKLRQLAFF